LLLLQVITTSSLF